MQYSWAENDILRAQAWSNGIPCTSCIQNVIQTVYVYWGKTAKMGHHFVLLVMGLCLVIPKEF